MTEFASRITQPGENQPLRISDLIELLDVLKHEHGDLWCYIYSSDKRASVPLLSLCLQVKHTTVSFSAQVESVCDEMMADLLDENEQLRRLTPVPADAAALPAADESAATEPTAVVTITGGTAEHHR